MVVQAICIFGIHKTGRLLRDRPLSPPKYAPPMARSQERKRIRSDESIPNDQPVKRAKPPGKENFSPAFWDDLSKIPLTIRALRELDRRNGARPIRKCKALKVYPKDRVRFARHGGPDLGHLRGYPEPQSAVSTMNSSRSSTTRSRASSSTNATTLIRESRKTSAYGRDFQQHLADKNIHMQKYKSFSPPANMAAIESALAMKRASLSPSEFTEDAFRSFWQSNMGAAFEHDVMETVIPVLCGTSAIPNQQNVRFTQSTPITGEGTAKPQPDFFDGSRLHELSQDVRNHPDVCSTVIPTNHASVPVAPNFYLEVKGPGGSVVVARRQACYDGAYGARAMHTLQNYGNAEPTYDGHAYTFSSIYSNGTLELYTHHVTAPTTSGGYPAYHMTPVGMYHILNNRKSFVKGATAFRNARDLTQQQRQNLIAAANARASQAGCVARRGTASDRNSTPESDTASYVDHQAWRDADDALQRHIAEECGIDLYDDIVAPRTPQDL
ncbi:hypothetical protein E4U41_005388 [Claviceps citrina]|nr:hypothetical protein E4U41_005388 [Claviceps citrina]